MADPPCVLSAWTIFNKDTPDGIPIIFDDGTASPAPSENTLVGATIYERQLGESELSYYLPSRESGVNDMSVSSLTSRSNRTDPFTASRRYLHLGFRAPNVLVQHERVCMVWAILRLRHPLLSSKIQMHDYNDTRFVCVELELSVMRISDRAKTATSPPHLPRML
jgi:hypothetical protein